MRMRFEKAKSLLILRVRCGMTRQEMAWFLATDAETVMAMEKGLKAIPKRMYPHLDWLHRHSIKRLSDGDVQKESSWFQNALVTQHPKIPKLDAKANIFNAWRIHAEESRAQNK